MKYNKLTLPLVAIPLFIATSSYAADINFSGFSTIASGMTTSSDEAFGNYTSDLGFREGSLFALQTSSNLGDGLSITAQLIARGNEEWAPKFEWAYIGYEINDNLQILAGRQRAPFFMYSDFLDVSYAYNWITPPTHVYQLGFDSFDGLGLIHTSQLGEFDSSLHLIAGRNQDVIDIGEGVEIEPDFNNLLGAAWTLNRDWLTLRAAYFQAKITFSAYDGLAGNWNDAGNGYIANGLEDLGRELINIGSSIKIEEDDVTFAELGFQIDYNDFIVIGEFTSLDQPDTGFADQDSFYLMVGKRFNSITVHMTYGEKDEALENILSGVSSNLPGLSVLYAGTEAFIADAKSEESYTTVGVRWDFHDSAALKFEATKFTDDLNDINDATLLNVALITVF